MESACCCLACPVFTARGPARSPRGLPQKGRVLCPQEHRKPVPGTLFTGVGGFCSPCRLLILAARFPAPVMRRQLRSVIGCNWSHCGEPPLRTHPKQAQLTRQLLCRVSGKPAPAAEPSWGTGRPTMCEQVCWAAWSLVTCGSGPAPGTSVLTVSCGLASMFYSWSWEALRATGAETEQASASRWPCALGEHHRCSVLDRPRAPARAVFPDIPKSELADV